MLYLANPSRGPVAEAMSAGLIGCMTTPAQGNIIPDGAWYACDNGKFGKGWPGSGAWFRWLSETVAVYGPHLCLWAVAPDVPFDAAGTLAESRPWLARIRDLGVPVAFAAQDGSEEPGMIPWDDIDVLFIAGSTEWKLSRAAGDLAYEAKVRGKRVHMGRVNSYKRLKHAVAIGCDTADGTYLAFGPLKNLERLLRWIRDLQRRERPAIQFPLLDLIPAQASVPVGASTGARLVHIDGGQGEFPYEPIPDPASEVLARRISEAGDFVEVVVVELPREGLPSGLDVGEVHDPTGLRVDGPLDVDGDAI